MNLLDIVKRKDRALVDVSAEISTGTRALQGRKMQTVELSPGSALTLRGALEFRFLKWFPPDFGWKWAAVDGRRARCRIEITAGQDDAGDRHLLSSVEARDDGVWYDVPLTWPPEVATLPRLDLRVSCVASEKADGARGVIGVSPVFNSRALASKLVRGVGVEVGPGVNPQIRPGPGVDVSYVETLTAEEWLALYRKREKPPPELTEDLWRRYVVSRAETLEAVPDGTLDFIFSNHVFEHLMNPLGVLENWSRKLRPTGLVYNVVPDAGCCFDLRQPLSEPQEWTAEYDAGHWEPHPGKYERWCRYTAPYNKPADLVARRYSIHVHYYSPETAAQLAGLTIERGWFGGHYVASARNHKDFAFLLFKGGASV